MPKFVVFATPSFDKRTKVCLDSIREYYGEEAIDYTKIEEVFFASYVPSLALKRLQRCRDLIKAGEQEVIMLGADCVLYGRLHPLHESSANITLVPHVIHPPTQRGAAMYMTGHANGDVVVFRQGSLPALEWLCEQQLVERPHEGVFYEQTWLSALPFCYPNIDICRHPGINFAWYNAHERPLSSDRHINGSPLLLAQYSGYQEGSPQRISKYYSGPDVEGPTLELFKEYDRMIT